MPIIKLTLSDTTYRLLLKQLEIENFITPKSTKAEIAKEVEEYISDIVDNYAKDELSK